MKQNKLLILSLLASFLLLTLATYAYAEDAVTFGTVDVCPQPVGNTVDVPVLIGNDVNVAAFDIVGEIVSDGNVDLVVTGVTFDDRMGLPETLDLRYPIGDLGGGLFRLGATKYVETNLLVGSGQIGFLTMEFVSDCELGTATIDPATANHCGSDVSTVFVDTDANVIQPTVYSGAVNVVNAAPSFTNCPTESFVIYWGDNVTYTFEADDPDLACGCDALTFSKVSGVGSISGNGVYTYTAPGADVGCQDVTVRVADSYGGEATCTFRIEVLNMPPEFTECPSETFNILWGQTVTVNVAAQDPDMGPSGMTFLLESFDGPGTPVVDPVTGTLTWDTQQENAYLGDFVACIRVTDGANLDECNTENSDICCVNIHVEPTFRVTITKVHDQLLGHFVSVPIYLDGSYTSMEMGGFDFLIAYDASILTFVDAEAGALLQDCGWEYFTYRFGADGNCDGGCPSGMLRIVAMAETNNGSAHPTCFDTDSGTELAVLNFYLSNDHNYDCLFLPIYWYWLDCGDNTISSKYGDTLFINDQVYRYYGDDGVDTWENITQVGDFAFPSLGGAPDVCLEGDKEFPLRAIDFKGGGIDVICDSLIDATGDINVNGISYEIADAVMFTNYFINGLSAFGDHVEASIAASDVNLDGTVLSVADMVYLVRVIQGDALAYPKPTPGASVTFNMQGEEVKYDANVDMGAALFVFNGENFGTPVLNVDGMEMIYGVDNGQLRVLIYNIGNSAIPQGEGVVLTVPGAELIEVEAAEFGGYTMDASFNILPTQYELAQNYPNPFNPTTTIMLSLPEASDYSLAIYNVAGQLIRTYSGHASAGEVSIVWDGKDASGSQVASGIYFYKANASSYSATKKMILMK